MTSRPGRRAVSRLLTFLLAITALTAHLSSAYAAAAAIDVLGQAGPITESWSYGAAAPAARRLTISAETERIELISSDAQGAEGACALYDSRGHDLASVENSGGMDYMWLAIRKGAVRAGSGDRYRVECWAGYIDNRKVTYDLYEGPGAGTVLNLNPDHATAITTAYARRYCTPKPDFDGPCTPVQITQPVRAGDRVTLKGQAPWAFAMQGRTPKLTVTLQPGGQPYYGVPSSTVIASGVSATVSADGSNLSFAVPGGLPAGSVYVIAKSVTTIAGSTTTPKHDQVTRWESVATYATSNADKTFTTAPTPTVTGSAIAGSTLTAKAGTWSPGTVSLTYRWNRNGIAIDNATASTYTLSTADAGTAISVTVTGAKSGYRSTAKVSTPVKVAALKTLTAPVARIVGEPIVGIQLRADPAAWGPAPVDVQYHWFASPTGSDYKWIWLGSGPAYTVQPDDIGFEILLEVAGYKAGYGATIKSARTPVVIAQGTLAPTPAPSISGTQRVGYTLTANPGTWGPAPVNLTYQWNRNGAAIAGATASTYKLTTADKNTSITVTVTGTKTGYAATTKTSTSKYVS